jgi:hypothetical protein
MKKQLLLTAAALFLPLALRAEPPVVAPAPAPAAEAAEQKDQFIRVEEKDAKPVALQTAVVRLTKGDATLELVGAIHIADKKYYQALNKRFEAYEALLWEGIGGDQPPAAAAPADKPAGGEPNAAGHGEKKKKSGRLDGLHGAYESAAKFLDLAYQMGEIDYTKPNFVHADLSMEEFSTLQAQRGESLFTFMLKAGLQAETIAPAKEPSTLKLLASLIKGDKIGLKQELVHTLGAGDDQVAALAGDSVIITDRNAKCLEVLAREVGAGRKKLGIFYGAAHFPDMVKRLAEAGWTLAGTEWVTAWDLAR